MPSCTASVPNSLNGLTLASGREPPGLPFPLNAQLMDSSTTPNYPACRNTGTRPTWRGGTMLRLRVAALGAAMALGFAASTISAQAAVPPVRQDVRHDSRDIRSDRRDIRSDTRNVRQDRRDMRSDRRSLVRDRRSLHRDRRLGNRAGVRADRRHFRHDVRRTRQDHRALSRNRTDRRRNVRDLRADRRDRGRDLRTRR